MSAPTDDKSINLVEKPEPELKPAEEKKPMKRSNSFSRRGKGGKKADEVPSATSGAKLGEGTAAAATDATAGAAEEDPADAIATKNEFKIESQADPILEAIQKQAKAYAEQGLFDEAGEEFHNLAQAAHQKGDKIRECAAWQNMALCIEHMAEMEPHESQARSYYHTALECYESALQLMPLEEEGNEAHRAELFEKLLYLCQAAGYQDDYEYGPKALEELRKLGIAFRAEDPPNYQSVVETYLRSSRLLGSQKEWKEAIIRLMAALEVTPKISEVAEGETAAKEKEEARAKAEFDVHYLLGTAHSHSGNEEEAVKHFKAALKLAQQIEDDKSALVVHRILASVFIQVSQLDEAVEQLQLAVPIAEKLNELNTAGMASLEMCQAHRMQGEKGWPSAVKAAEHAVTVAEKMHEESRDGVWEAIGDCNTRLAAVHVASGQPKKALEYLYKATQIWEGTCTHFSAQLRDRRKGLGFDEEGDIVCDDPQTTGFMDEKSDTAVLLVQALLATEPKESLKPVFAAEAARCAALRSIIHVVDSPDEDEDAIQDISDPDPTAAAVVALGANSTSSPAPSLVSTPEHLEELMTHVVDSDGNGTLLYYAYLESEPERQGVVAHDPAAPTDEVCLWVIGASGTVQAVEKMAVVSKDGTPIADLYRHMALKTMAQMHKGGVTRGNLPDVKQMLEDKQLQGVEPDGGAISLAPELSALTELLLTPALPYLKPGAPVAIVSHYLLQVLPFGAMPLPDGSGTLIDAHPIISAPSLTVLRQLVARGTSISSDATKESLVVGGVEPHERYQEQFELKALPGALAEATRVSEALKTSPMSGKDATALNIALALKNKNLRYVHLASHMIDESCLLSPNPEYSDAYQAADKIMRELIEKETPEESAEYQNALRDLTIIKEQEDGDIFSLGVLSPPTLAKLPNWSGRPTVVLSGSSGAIGKVSYDGLQSMARAMICSGARSVLASVWETDDAAAAHLTTAFIDTLTKDPSITQAEALRRAIKSTREAEDGKWNHPSYWAGFSLVGGTARGV